MHQPLYLHLIPSESICLINKQSIAGGKQTYNSYGIHSVLYSIYHLPIWLLDCAFDVCLQFFRILQIIKLVLCWLKSKNVWKFWWILNSLEVLFCINVKLFSSNIELQTKTKIKFLSSLNWLPCSKNTLHP